MKIDGKQLTFPKTLSVKYSANLLAETDTDITIEADDDESYLKIYTPFRGVAKLFVFENEKWVDAETSTSISGLDLSSLGLENISASDLSNSADDSSNSAENDLFNSAENEEKQPTIITP